MFGLVVSLLASLALLSLALALAGFVLLATAPGRRFLRREWAGRERALLVLGWTAATVATAASLWLSLGVGLIPCSLCWYQRIAMYPLVAVLGVAALRDEPDAWRYALPLAGIGAIISAYHVLLQLVPAAEIAECTSAAPCTMRYVAVYGFVSIPVMAGSVFLLVAATLLTVASVDGGQRRNGG